jgi:hypothetical protein
LATTRLTVIWSGVLFIVAPPAVVVAMSHTSCGIGWRTNVVDSAGLPKVPLHENDPLVVWRLIWIASASAGVQSHMRSGASMPRGHTVLS